MICAMRLVRLAPVLVAILVASCGGAAGQPTQDSGRPSIAATAVAPATAPPASISSLLGTWRRIGACQPFVDAMLAAGFGDRIGTADGLWMAGGVTPKGTDPTAPDYCSGATTVAHSHFFHADGKFGSLDENGQQVDDGTFVLRGSDVIDFGTLQVRFAIDASDHLRFVEIIAPDRCPQSGFGDGSPDSSGLVDCSTDHAWAISAFYPGPYDRVP